MSSQSAVASGDASPNTKAYLALVSVCFFWGTTYLGIRMALEGFAPTVLISLRFLFSGGILLAALWWRGYPFPRRNELWKTALTGVITIGGGNGFLTYAEQIIPSGLAAIFITLAPFWFVGIDALLPNGTRLHAPTLFGMAVGLLGAIILVMPGEEHPIAAGSLIAGGLMLQAGSALWAGGSMLQKRVTLDAHPFVAGAIQQFAVGIAFAPFAAVAGWQDGIHFAARPTWALLYLIFFGAIVGYSSYIYALSHLPVALVSIYNYVNPVVAVALGWLFYREPFGWRETIAMLVIFTGVALVKRFTPSRPPR